MRGEASLTCWLLSRDLLALKFCHRANLLVLESGAKTDDLWLRVICPGATPTLSQSEMETKRDLLRESSGEY
jgi:hypothetical protein